MTAPAAPVLRVRALGGPVRISFAAVPTAATYNIYEGGATAPTTAVLTGITALDTVYQPIYEPSFIRVAAVNSGAEVSAYSNEVRVDQPTGLGTSFPPSRPTDGKVRRGPFG